MTQPNECSGGPTGPTGAERVRTLLAAADSLTVTTDEHSCSLVGLHSLDAVGRVLLSAPAQFQVEPELSWLVTNMLAAAGGDVEAIVEVTDVAAVATRDRVRARVTVHGWLSLDHAGDCYGTPELTLDIRVAQLAERGSVVTVGPDELAAADVDPLAAREAELLLHLADAHPDAVELLTRLIEPAELQWATRVLPVALDRYGVVLRVERRRAHRDIRLPFGIRARDWAEAQAALSCLLGAAARRPRRCRQGTAPPA